MRGKKNSRTLEYDSPALNRNCCGSSIADALLSSEWMDSCPSRPSDTSRELTRWFRIKGLENLKSQTVTDSFTPGDENPNEGERPCPSRPSGTSCKLTRCLE